MTTRSVSLFVVAGLAAAASAMAQTPQNLQITPNGVLSAASTNGYLNVNAITGSLTSAGFGNGAFTATNSSGADYLTTFAWAFRVGNQTRERYIATNGFPLGGAISDAAASSVQQNPPVVVTNGTASSTLTTYKVDGVPANPFSFLSQQTYAITAGVGGPTFTCTNVITNLSTTSSLTLNLFNLGDFSIPTGSGNTTVTYTPGVGPGGENGFVYSRSGATSSLSVWASAFTNYQASATAAQTTAGSITELLNNLSVNNFNNTPAPGGASVVGSDGQNGFQWTLTIAPGGSATVVSGARIPAPGAMALLGLGGLIAGRRRRA